MVQLRTLPSPCFVIRHPPILLDLRHKGTLGNLKILDQESSRSWRIGEHMLLYGETPKRCTTSSRQLDHLFTAREQLTQGHRVTVRSRRSCVTLVSLRFPPSLHLSTGVKTLIRKEGRARKESGGRRASQCHPIYPATPV